MRWCSAPPAPSSWTSGPPWWGPCLRIAPILEEIAREYGDRLTIDKLDVDRNPVTAAAYRITGMPTLHIFQDGEVAASIRGAKPRSLLLRDLEPFLS